MLTAGNFERLPVVLKLFDLRISVGIYKVQHEQLGRSLPVVLLLIFFVLSFELSVLLDFVEFSLGAAVFGLLLHLLAVGLRGGH